MKTSLPIATISYNSKPFLVSKLNYLLNKKNLLDFWCFIEHLPEEDEKKKHIHLFMMPAESVQTKELLSNFDEIDENNNKPLRCLPAVKSKFADWYLYCLHDAKYLLSKGQARLHHYEKSEIVSSSPELLDDFVHRIDRSKFVGIDRLKNAIDNEIPFPVLFSSGQVPIQLIKQYADAYGLLSSCRGDTTERAGRQSHTPAKNAPGKKQLVDLETGQVYSSLGDFTKSTGKPLAVTQGLVDDVS